MHFRLLGPVEIEVAGQIEIIRAALDLWRGPSLGNAASDWLRDRLCTPLEEERLAAVEELASASLALRREREVLPELAHLAATHPGRESVIALHMRASVPCFWTLPPPAARQPGGPPAAPRRR